MPPESALGIQNRTLRHYENFQTFFFSSRRRHTRCLSDWSSDVCSSDLKSPSFSIIPRIRINGSRSSRHRHLRSEERRVGKECRSRRLPEDVKKQDNLARAAGGEGQQLLQLGSARQHRSRIVGVREE